MLSPFSYPCILFLFYFQLSPVVYSLWIRMKTPYFVHTDMFATWTSHLMSRKENQNKAIVLNNPMTWVCEKTTVIQGNLGVSLSLTRVSKDAKIRNRYNQVPHLTQDTNGKVTNSQLYTTNESQAQQVTTRHK